LHGDYSFNKYLNWEQKGVNRGRLRHSELIKHEHFSGSTDGKINCWNTDTGVRVAVFNCDHPGPVQCVQFNPKLMMLATACTNMVGHCNKLIKSRWPGWSIPSLNSI
jgi:WD40 repeat protein